MYISQLHRNTRYRFCQQKKYHPVKEWYFYGGSKPPPYDILGQEMQ